MLELVGGHNVNDNDERNLASPSPRPDSSYVFFCAFSPLVFTRFAGDFAEPAGLHLLRDAPLTNVRCSRGGVVSVTAYREKVPRDLSKTILE